MHAGPKLFRSPQWPMALSLPKTRRDTSLQASGPSMRRRAGHEADALVIDAVLVVWTQDTWANRASI